MKKISKIKNSLCNIVYNISDAKIKQDESLADFITKCSVALDGYKVYLDVNMFKDVFAKGKEDAEKHHQMVVNEMYPKFQDFWLSYPENNQNVFVIIRNNFKKPFKQGLQLMKLSVDNKIVYQVRMGLAPAVYISKPVKCEEEQEKN